MANCPAATSNSALIKSEAVLNGFDEALVLTHEGHIAEGSAENLFMVRDGVLITPPVHSNVLEGITRRTVMHLAQQELGLPVVERDIDRSEIYVADEAFFCGTGVQIAVNRLSRASADRQRADGSNHACRTRSLLPRRPRPGSNYCTG